jgi:hypothetical protein
MSIPNFPKQKLSRGSKDKNWGIDSLDAVIAAAFVTTANYTAYKTYYDSYNGILDPSEYKYVTDPYKNTNKTYKLPSRVRNYNIIRPIIDLLLGEKTKRPLNYHVVVKNADAVTQKEEEMQQAVMGTLKQQFINQLNEAGLPTGNPSEETQDPAKVQEEFQQNYRDMRAVMGGEALEYMMSYLEIPDNLMTAFFDWLVTGVVCTYKAIDHEEPYYEIVNPMDLSYPDVPNVRFIEDLPSCVRKSSMTANDIVDKFYDELTPSQIDYLESPGSGFYTGTTDGFFLNRAGQNSLPGELIDVYHGVWKSFKREGILHYQDPQTGQEEETRVSDIYKPDTDAGEWVEWFWINEVYEGYRIDKDIYLGIKPIVEQRNRMNNPSICKLPYNGRVYSNRNSDPVSIVSLGIPYQVLYNIFHYRLELSIAKNKDKIALIEINTIPKRHGWDEEKFMYHADANGFAFIDSTAEGKDKERVTFNNYQVLDMSLGQYIAAQFELLVAVKTEWEEMLGISRQRKGNVMASDGQGTTERAVYQSAIMTEDMFRKFETVEQRDLQGLLDISQIAWVNGKKATYIASDYRQAYLQINPEMYCNSDFGVFVMKSGEEQDKLQALKSLALEFAQNKANPSTIAEILDSNSFSKIKMKLGEVETAAAQMEQQMSQAEQEMKAMELQNKINEREDNQAFTAEQNELQRLADEKLLLLKLNAESMAVESVEAPEDNSVELEKLDLDREKHYSSLAEQRAARVADIELRQSELASKERIEKDKLRVAEKKLVVDRIKAKAAKKPAAKKK